MAKKDPDAEAVVKEVNEILERTCMPAMIKTCNPQKIEPKAMEWWLGHYRVYFYFAIRVKGRDWATDGPGVMKALEVLGKEAQRLANGGPITEEHAKAASVKLDCLQLMGAKAARQAIWCAP